MKKKLNGCVYDEYERLKSLFALETLDESKKTLIDELLQQMAFMIMQPKKQFLIIRLVNFNISKPFKLALYF